MSVQDSTKEKTKSRLKEPSKYNVIMHNDDFTTMEFVVYVLETVFRKNSVEAELLMMKVHNEGKSIVGTYTFDIAATRVKRAMSMAKAEGYPFLVTLEEV